MRVFLRRSFVTGAVVFGICFSWSQAGQAAVAPIAAKGNSALFARGKETFIIKDSSGKTPTFRVLDDNPAERALAAALIATINANPEVKPKIPNHEYVDLKVEKMSLVPLKNDPSRLGVGVFVSGYDLALPQTVSREKFLAGQMIHLNFPAATNDVSLFSIESGGELKFHLDRKTQNIKIENAAGRVTLRTLLSGEGRESIRFSGRGERQVVM